MAALPIIPPRIVGTPGIDSPTPKAWFPAPGATWREGAFLLLTTTGTVVIPTPTGSMAALPGPSTGGSGPFSITSSSFSVTAGNFTIAGHANTAAPAATYYCIASYTATTNQSLPSAEFACSCPAGVVPAITVASAGAPTAADHFALFVGVFPGSECLQQATTTTTALGAAFNVPWTLTNSQGVTNGSTNMTTGNVGIATSDSAANYGPSFGSPGGGGIGGSMTGGAIQSQLGTWANPPPLGAPDPEQALVLSVANGAQVEMSLKQAFYGASSIGAAFGLTLDSTTGYFIADTGATAAGTIVDKVWGASSDVGTTGDTNSRVIVTFTPANCL